SKAINDGVNLISYCPWSFMNVLSSSDGIEKRYGLVYIDRTDFDCKNLKRIPKDSFYLYQKCIQKNGDIE
ncbi:family 1 glycosylhydrolase, partial [Faecalibacillus faecis]|uniref:family 1 glycosylhydrolase n=1 Tax=Faecalibacillus faecis TaxID=1982628 RepID=UPI00210A2FD5